MGRPPAARHREPGRDALIDGVRAARGPLAQRGQHLVGDRLLPMRIVRDRAIGLDRVAHLAKNSSRSPYSAGRSASSRSRIQRANAGLRPFVEMPSCRSPRRTTATAKKSQYGMSSTAWVRMRSARASVTIRAFTARSSVAAMARNAPSRSPCWYSRWWSVMLPAAASSAMRGDTSGLTTVISAPVKSSASIFSIAILPPPATSTRLPSRTSAIG